MAHDDDDTKLSSRVLHEEACPKCGSLDNVKVYDDGHKKCWSGGCDYWVPPDKIEEEGGGEVVPFKAAKKKPAAVGLLQGGTFQEMEARKLKVETLKNYGIFRTVLDGHEIAVFNYYDDKAVLANQKLRLPGKQFSVRYGTVDAPRMEQCLLFGQQFYGERYDRIVVLTVGEFDAASVGQAMNFKTPGVGAGPGDDMALKHVQNNWRWLDRFQTIVLWMDDDTSGQKLVDPIAKLFKVGKVKIAKVVGFKDANEVLVKGQSADIVSAVYGASTWRPRGIINAADCEADMEDITVRGWEWPLPGLNRHTLGIRKGTVNYVVAGTGVGKTTLFYMIAYGLLAQGVKVAHFGFEDERRDVQLGYMGLDANRRLTIDPLPRDEMKALHRKLFGKRSLEIFDSETAEWGLEAILGYARYAAKALDCEAEMLDPLSFIIAGLAAKEDERRALDHVSQELAVASRELDISLLISHHLRRVGGEGKSHEEGGRTSVSQLRGSGGIANFATTVVGIERNQQEEGEASASPVALIRLLKNRKPGWTGVCDHVIFNHITGAYDVVDPPTSTTKGGKKPQPSRDIPDDY